MFTGTPVRKPMEPKAEWLIIGIKGVVIIALLINRYYLKKELRKLKETIHTQATYIASSLVDRLNYSNHH